MKELRFEWPKRWKASINHKDIGFLYFFFGLWCGLVGFGYSLMIRLQLSKPGNDFLTGHLYNTYVTAHGLIMVFWFIMPVLMSGFGNLFFPLLMGIPDLFFTRLNNCSFWTFFFSFFLLLASVAAGGVGTGWTVYVPLSLRPFSSGYSVDFGALSLHMVGLASLMASLNFVSTFFKTKAKGTSFTHVNIYLWTIVVTGVMLIAALPVLAAGLTMLLADRNFNTCFFVPKNGGDLLLWQHLFWFFGHPEVYIIILPGFGVISLVLHFWTSKFDVFGKKAMIYALWSIGAIGFVVWAHHMYVTGLDIDTRAYFTIATLVVGVPTGVKIFNWLMTLFGWVVESKAAVLWTVGFIFLFTIGGVTGVMLANAVIDVLLHDTYYVVGHFHYTLSMGAVFSLFAGFFSFWPLVTGFTLHYRLVKSHFLIVFIGANLTFFPMFIIGVKGGARRVWDYPVELTLYHRISSWGSLVLAGSVWLLEFIIWESLAAQRPYLGVTSENFNLLGSLGVPLKGHTHTKSICFFKVILEIAESNEDNTCSEFEFYSQISQIEFSSLLK